jgi:chemotaxis protein MotB
MNYWPGFVDALSTLVLSVIFILTVFVVVQYFLAMEVSGKDTALSRLNAQIARLTEMLSLEKANKAPLEDQIAQMRASIATAEGERDKYKNALAGLAGGAETAEQRSGALSSQLDDQKSISARALAQVEVLNQQIGALRRQLAALESALDVSEKSNQESQTRLTELGQRLNVALARRIQELSRYRSDFFGRLREILGNRPDIRIVGDRFVFQSEVLFDSGQAILRPEGKEEIDKIATALKELAGKIPAEIPWVLRVDGHTDARPINSPQFKSNWDLSAARAISVVQYLITQGIPPNRLVAAGFGEFQPIDPGTTDEAYKKNRRIELKLTER